MNTCDVTGCDYQDEALEDQDSGIPEGWATVELPDSTGEHQQYRVCPRHVDLLWKVVEGEIA